MDMYGFYTGEIFDAYEYLGAHITPEGTIFRTFAPGAERIEVLIGNRAVPMRRVHDGNFYEAIVSEAGEGSVYEYRIWKRDGSFQDHCDPYGFGMELRPDHKSVVRSLGAYTFHDQQWMKRRTARQDGPLNIYEMHAGSWRRKEDGSWYGYDELAKPLIDYLKAGGYNYVEFLPLGEHPCDESWGYQATGFFAPTSRYGTTAELMELIDLLHQNGIGAILDFVPAHFALDAYGLSQYDGTALYEYPHQDVGVSEWGSCNFMHSRGEVRSFLQSAANYWLKEYHFDGLRMDAISRMIYWQGDERRGVNGNATAFLKHMNQGLKKLHPGCILAAEDSTNFPGVTKSTDQGGLGFDYKWDLGWMHDTLEYFQSNPEDRTEKYHKLTFSMMYFRDEHFLLPFSHDEVVHGKATVLQKMNGRYEQKFPQARAMYLYMMIHPGKKLNFMGNEIGHFREWDEKREQDWELLRYPVHDAFHHYISELNGLYLSHPAFWAWDYRDEGFEWLDCHQEERRIYAVLRRSGKERLAAVFNFSEQRQEEYRIRLSGLKAGKVLLYSDWQRFGGSTREDECVLWMEGDELVCTLQPFSAVLAECTGEETLSPK